MAEFCFSGDNKSTYINFNAGSIILKEKREKEADSHRFLHEVILNFL
jgi:hypothetical protein